MTRTEALAVKEAVRARDGNCCTGCGLTAAAHLARYGKALDVHRLAPGGPYTIEGCVTLCRKCHGSQPRRPVGQMLREDGVIFARIREDLGAALERYMDDQRYRPKLTAVLEEALAKLLEDEGYWPPKE